MNTASEGQWQEWDDTAEDAPEPRNASSRRLLLGGAAGGLALAASGLLVPDWLVEEAEADKHPVRRVQDRKQRKREKRRHQRLKQNRTQRRREDASAAPGIGAFILGVRAEVFAEYGPLNVKFFFGTFSLSNTAGPFSIAAGNSKTYGTEDLNLLAQFQVGSDTPAAPAQGVVDVILRNPAGTPDVSVRNGHFIDNNVINQQSLREGQSIDLDIEIYRDVMVKLNIRRNADSNDFKEFRVNVGPRL